MAVVVLGPVPDPRGIAAAFAAGASGYVRHDERIEGVERAMAKARTGEVAVAQPLLQGAFAELLNPARQPDDEGARLLEMLTPREVEVLVRVAEGEDTRLIAGGHADRAEHRAHPCAAGADEARRRLPAGGGGARGPYRAAGARRGGAAGVAARPVRGGRAVDAAGMRGGIVVDAAWMCRGARAGAAVRGDGSVRGVYS